MWGLRPDLLRPSPKRAPFQPPPCVAEERGGFRGGGHLSPPRLALDKCNVGLKAGFTPAVSQAGPFPTASARGRGRGGVPRGGHLSPPRIGLDKCHVGLKAGFTPAVSQAGPCNRLRAWPRRG